LGSLIAATEGVPDGLRDWAAWFFGHVVTTKASSQHEQARDITLFIEFMLNVEKTDERSRWTPRLSAAFREFMLSARKGDGSRKLSDRTINRVIAHLKPFSKWIHSLRPFPLDNPMKKIKAIPVTNALEIERAINPGERRRILDAADFLLQTGGRSKSRRRYAKAGQTGERPCRKGYRVWRNRAIIYTLLETGMRRTAITKIDLCDVDKEHNRITVEEKGGSRHAYEISQEGMGAILDYVDKERAIDSAKWQSPALFLVAGTVTQSSGRLTARAINQIWDDVCKVARVEGRTPHSARHAMGVHIMKKFGNVAAVQRQLGHKNAAYSMQYARVTSEELQSALNDR
jgi:integrase